MRRRGIDAVGGGGCLQPVFRSFLCLLSPLLFVTSAGEVLFGLSFV